MSRPRSIAREWVDSFWRVHLCQALIPICYCRPFNAKDDLTLVGVALAFFGLEVSMKQRTVSKTQTDLNSKSLSSPKSWFYQVKQKPIYQKSNRLAQQVHNSPEFDKGTWISDIFPWSNSDKHLDKKSYQTAFHKQLVKGFFLGKTGSKSAPTWVESPIIFQQCRIGFDSEAFCRQNNYCDHYGTSFHQF